MNAVVAVNNWRDAPPQYFEFPEEWFDEYPELPFKLGELVGLYIKIKEEKK